MRRLTAAPGGLDPRGDDGVTLVEQLVAMSIFVVVVSLFMSGLVSMTSGTSRTQNTAESGDSVRAAFLRMDRQVRYASDINQAGTGASGDWYVEFRSPQQSTSTTSTRSDVPAGLCTQWRYGATGGHLDMRTWTDGTTPTSSWTPVATGLQRPATPPFSVALTTDGQPFQRLGVHLVASRGAGAAEGSAEIETTFVARNSSPASVTNVDGNHDGVTDSPVCTAGSRA